MKIDVVKAFAFGPLTDKTLELAPGMTVVYGPNESGKSSWHAALYAGLCGMRRSRGTPTRRDQIFTARHRPWQGRSWKVMVKITLDDGRQIVVEQSLGAGGRSTAIDPSTKKSFTSELLREGAVDATHLLGLTRESALSTLFVQQADVLRVLADAKELQEYLARAAATTVIVTTAPQALERIATYKRDWVGRVVRGATGPLAVATKRLTDARVRVDSAQEGYEAFQELLARRHDIEVTLTEAQAARDEVQQHEKERARAERWAAIRAAERQIAQARDLQQIILAGPQDLGPEPEVIAALTAALGAFKSRPALPAELVGPSVEELEQELAALPERPAGDLEPAPEVAALLQAWRQAGQRVAAHQENRPAVTELVDLPAPPSELRRLADDLQAPMPVVDESLREEIHRRGQAPASPPRVSDVHLRSTGQERPRRLPGFVPLAGASLAVGGVLLAIFGQLVLGAGLIIVGVGLATVAIALRARSAGGPGSVPASSTISPPSTDADLTRLEARLMFQEEVLAQARMRYEAARRRAVELGLPEDPEEIRKLASDHEDGASARERSEAWAQRAAELGLQTQTAEDQLRNALHTRGVDVGEDEAVEVAVERYAEECRQRARLATQAEGRIHLEARMGDRRAAEAARTEDMAARQRAEQQLKDAAGQVGISASAAEELANDARTWLRAEEELREPRRSVAQARARLDQLLDGQPIEELATELEELRASSGEPPQKPDAILPDRSADLADLENRTSVLRDRAAEFSGELEGAERHLLHVSEEIEAEARAEAEVKRLNALEEDLDVVTRVLTSAKERVHANMAPVLNETIHPWIPRITQGRYDDARVDPATLELQVHETGGQFRAATVLSQGTTEQLFLLLRLALATHLATTGESAPLILDDVTVQSDAERTVAILDLLHELSRERQVVLFSQEDEVLGWAKEHLNTAQDRVVPL
jgi:exonuclease SbcC